MEKSGMFVISLRGIISRIMVSIRVFRAKPFLAVKVP